MFSEHGNESLEGQLRELQACNGRIKAENEELAERVKEKWREGKELKKRLMYLQGLEGRGDEGKSMADIGQSKSKKQLGQSKENSLSLLAQLQDQFNELMQQSRKTQGPSKTTTRLQLGQLALKIKSLKGPNTHNA